jgi:uncharacterized radical SAM superfamily protein
MVDVSRENALYDLGTGIVGRGGKGMLVSGGCDPEGAVAFPDFTFREIRRLKEETTLLINLHCGLIDEETAERISWSLVDKVSFDLVYHDPTIKHVLNLEKTREDYITTLELLSGKGLSVVPHILAGLDHGKLSWEWEAVDRLSDMDDRINEVILIILIPTKGTPFENLTVPREEEVLDLVSYMREKLTCRLVLGCMRPKGYHTIETGSLEKGFDGIVLPSRKTLSWIKGKEYQVEERNICCCF